MTFVRRLQVEVMWDLCRGFAALPYWFRYYVVEDIGFFVLYYCLRYRMRVVKENLRNSFPEKSRLELLRNRRRFYSTLSEIFVDSVSLARARAQEMIRFPNAAEQSAATAGRDWIALMAHFGCWEYGAFWGLCDPTQVIVAVYHPLRSAVMVLL